MSEHGEALEADLARYYGTRLSDLFSGRLSWRRLDVLVRHLPADSATAHALYGAAVEWSPTEHLLASVVDALNVMIWQNSPKGARPRPIPRPGQRKAASLGRTQRSPDEVRTYLARFRPAQEEASCLPA